MQRLIKIKLSAQGIQILTKRNLHKVAKQKEEKQYIDYYHNYKDKRKELVNITKKLAINQFKSNI